MAEGRASAGGAAASGKATGAGWHFILDLDGVVYREKELLPGARAFFEAAAAEGSNWVFVTNNSTRTPASFAERLTKLGIPTEPERVLTSSVATARYLRGPLREELGHPVRAMVIGETGLFDTLQEAGIEIVDAGEAWAERNARDRAIDAVVVGLDTRFDYTKLRAACHFIRRGAIFIGTNPDKTFPYADGIGPGCGALLAAVEACSGKSPRLMGKPGRPLLEAALDRLGLAELVSTLPFTAASAARSASGPSWPASSPGPTRGLPSFQGKRVLIIGDRLDTDIAFARRHGLPSCLVLTGVTSPRDVADLEALPGEWRPDWVVANLGELAARLFPCTGAPGG